MSWGLPRLMFDRSGKLRHEYNPRRDVSWQHGCRSERHGAPPSSRRYGRPSPSSSSRRPCPRPSKAPPPRRRDRARRGRRARGAGHRLHRGRRRFRRTWRPTPTDASPSSGPAPPPSPSPSTPPASRAGSARWSWRGAAGAGPHPRRLPGPRDRHRVAAAGGARRDRGERPRPVRLRPSHHGRAGPRRRAAPGARLRPLPADAQPGGQPHDPGRDHARPGRQRGEPGPRARGRRAAERPLRRLDLLGARPAHRRRPRRGGARRRLRPLRQRRAGRSGAGGPRGHRGPAPRRRADRGRARPRRGLAVRGRPPRRMGGARVGPRLHHRRVLRGPARRCADPSTRVSRRTITAGTSRWSARSAPGALFLRGGGYRESRGNGTALQENATDIDQGVLGLDLPSGGGGLRLRADLSDQDYDQTFSAIAADRRRSGSRAPNTSRPAARASRSNGRAPSGPATSSWSVPSGASCRARARSWPSPGPRRCRRAPAAGRARPGCSSRTPGASAAA